MQSNLNANRPGSMHIPASNSKHLRQQGLNPSDPRLQPARSRITQSIKLFYVQSKKPTQSNNIMSCLRNHFIFYNLSQQQLQNIKNKMFYAECTNNTIIYDQQTIGMCFFIVIAGKLEVLADDRYKKELKNMDGFGEIALLYNCKRKQTVRAIEDCKFWVIDRITFRQAVEEVIVKEYIENRKCLEGIRFFVNLTNQQKDIIASALITQKFYKNQTIVQQGDPGSALYYIKQGTASVYKGPKFLRKVSKGDSFGQQSLYYNTMRQLTIKADQQVTCLILGRDTLNRVLGDKVYDVTFKNFIRWAFQKNPIMSKLSRQNMDSVIESMKISSFKMNQFIFRKGVKGFQKLVVVIEGSLKKLKAGTIVVGKCQCYGEEFMTEENSYKILDDQVIMQTNGVIAEISDSAFYQALGGHTYSQVIKNIQVGRIKKVTQYENNIKKQLLNITPEQLIVKNSIAKGQFGDVYLVKDQNNKQYIAKVMQKKQLQQAQVQQFILDQSKVMQFISFPFIVKCGKRFQSKQHLIYINQYVKGEQFYQVLKKLGLLSTSDGQFYTAIIILILQYLQNVQVICRDIKPQNFLVGTNGYLKLINLSTAKISKFDSTNKMTRTFTIIGTPHYMAPDIVLGKGYTNLVDLWSLGVCLYQFLCGNLPFGDSSEGAYEIYEQIMQKDLKFPDFIHDKKAKKLIEQLLNHTPEYRHGGSFNVLKNHSWFEKIDWDKIINQNWSEPPYIPYQKLSTKKNQSIIDDNLVKFMKQMDIFQSKKYKKNPNRQFDWNSFGEKII